MNIGQRKSNAGKFLRQCKQHVQEFPMNYKEKVEAAKAAAAASNRTVKKPSLKKWVKSSD